MEKLLKVLTDPVSNKILQMIRVNGQMSISEIMSENTGLPRATVYRKIEKMLEVGAIGVVQTRKVRGQTENIYAVREMYIANPATDEDGMKIVTIGLMQILDLFDGYFSSGKTDVERDKLFLLNYAIELSDEDYSEMTKELLGIIDRYQKKKSQNAKMRNLYLISAPKGENNE